LILSTRRRIPVALVATLRRVVALRPALVPVAVSLAVALLAFLTALLSTGILRTTLVLVARHVSIPALLISLIWLSHWFLLGRLVGRPVRSKLDAELITFGKAGFEMMRGDGDVVRGWKNRLRSANANVTPAAILCRTASQNGPSLVITVTTDPAGWRLLQSIDVTIHSWHTSFEPTRQVSSLPSSRNHPRAAHSWRRQAADTASSARNASRAARARAPQIYPGARMLGIPPSILDRARLSQKPVESAQAFES
jgi:hypothetical protein